MEDEYTWLVMTFIEGSRPVFRNVSEGLYYVMVDNFSQDAHALKEAYTSTVVCFLSAMGHFLIRVHQMGHFPIIVL